MTIPPFPSQDLAKLVLGYLAEEQLMTAYDEFLQASPYLDALRNEYDRIFMTSLKNILAEYRAVKIYVETCKPFMLRKKLVQCTNLLEVVKLLVTFADVNKLQSQDVNSDKVSVSKPSISKQQICEVCASLNLSSCECKSKQGKFNSDSASHVETNSLEKSVETTALEDLPGNHVTTRRRHSRILDKDAVSESALNLSDNSRQSATVLNISNSGLNCNSQSTHTKSSDNSSFNAISSIVKATETPGCKEKIEEFNNILNKVCNKSNTDTKSFSISESENLGCSRPLNSSFQDFASGINGPENKNIPVPDSSTSENLIAQNFISDNNRDMNNTANKFTHEANKHSGIQTSNSYPFPRIKPKMSHDQKIKIISDVKVDSPFATKSNATSTPLMQTIVINGTPAYKQKMPVASNNYTKDEIMAMPTIIVVPTSGPPPNLTKTQPALSQKINKVNTNQASSTRLLGPLVIDVSSSSSMVGNNNTSNAVKSSQSIFDPQNSGLETGLIKTVDVTKNASVPKDNTISGDTHTNTPQVLPPLRKSSSTPRRNSHIRVLDFNTPRRILHETINEKVSEEPNNKAVEFIVTRNPNVVYAETSNANNVIDMSAVKVHKIDTCQMSNLQKDSIEIKTVTQKKSNWDADLRALAIANEKAQVTKKKPRIRNKKKADNREDQPENNTDTADSSTVKRSRSKRKVSPKVKKSKRRKLEEEEEQYNESVKTNETKVAIKPTFHVVPANHRNTQQESTKTIESQNNSNSGEINETPEAEKILLQNEIGAKLNISDLLETPYKQALYDIQMETPKFLGSVLPDEPISDIKIMNIPTPTFFDTPKPQATPYSSRATDYSSGGSYYKPDEQDYHRIPDLECPVTSSKEDPNIRSLKDNKNDSKKISRPVRKCTKNVSYKSGAMKNKGVDDKIEIASTCSDSTSANSSYNLDNSQDNTKTPKTPKPPKTTKEKKSKLNPKSDSKKRLDIKIKKSPMKKEKSNTFMKIKPRRPTPVKDNKRTRRITTTSQTNSPRSQVKKRVGGKDKNAQMTPMLTSAPTKSRRKSSTPRKLHCTKQFNSESSADSPDINITNVKTDVTKEQRLGVSHDSDTEQLALRWSDDGSQDAKSRVSECEDISKIKEYIENTVINKNNYNDGKGTLQVDLIKRGFDAETAKIIERDLLDTPPDVDPNPQAYIQISVAQKDVSPIEKITEADTSVAGDLQIVQDSEEDDMDLSVYECNEESDNYIIFNSDTKDIFKGHPVTLKDAWSMEVCIEDGVPIRLRATNFNQLFDSTPQNEETGYSFRETEVAVSSISNIEKLYTPLKDRRTQCYEIFDSTLTSLDTPLKLNSPKEKVIETTEIEIVVEEETVEFKDKLDTKPEAQLLFNSTNIQNIDIESVLKKLHGPS